MNKTYIWDLDGTLLDSYDVISNAVLKTVNEFKIEDDIVNILKRIKETSVRKYLTDISIENNISLDNLYETYHKYAHNNDVDIKLIKGAYEALLKLKNEGDTHFVYTHRGNSSEAILKRLGIYEFFKEIVTSKYGFMPKPSGEGVKYIINKYNLDINETYYVGDRTLDVFCAKDANIKAILYLPNDSYVLPTGKEDIIIKELIEL